MKLASTPRARRVLITGLPNYIAQRLVTNILTLEPETQLMLLVRPDMRSRTEELIGRRPGNRARVEILFGDIVAPNLGLSPAHLRRVCEEVTDVYHLASLYHLGADKTRLEEVNIRGSRNLLSVAKRMRGLKRLNYYSSAFVAGNRSGIILESELEKGQKFRNTYERTRFTAELEVRRATRALPISIFRPSLVVGDSQNGEIDNLDGPFFLLPLAVNNPGRMPIALPSAHGFPFNVVPADYVTNAIHFISLQADSEGKTYHLVDPNPISIEHAMRLIAEYTQRAGGRGAKTGWVADSLLKLPPFEYMARQSRAYLHELDTLTFFNAQNTARALRGSEVHCPAFPDYVEHLVRWTRRDLAGWLEEDKAII